MGGAVHDAMTCGAGGDGVEMASLSRPPWSLGLGCKPADALAMWQSKPLAFHVFMGPALLFSPHPVVQILVVVSCVQPALWFLIKIVLCPGQPLLPCVRDNVDRLGNFSRSQLWTEGCDDISTILFSGSLKGCLESRYNCWPFRTSLSLIPCMLQVA